MLKMKQNDKKQSKSISDSLFLFTKNLAYPIFLVQDIFIDNFNGYVFQQYFISTRKHFKILVIYS